MTSFHVSPRQRALLSPVADVLESLGYINPESVPSGSSVLVHAFSNGRFTVSSASVPLVDSCHQGGAAQVVTLSDVLKDRAAKRTHGHKDSYDVPSALILDSAPGDSSIGSAVAAFTITIRSPFIRYPAMFIAWLIFASLFLFHALLGRKRQMEEVTRALQRTHLLPWIGEATPRLYIYSKRDALIPYTTVAQHAAEARALGYAVDTEVFDKTMHVAHMRSDPDRYWAAVQRVWRTATDAAASHS
ncbi:hypothetical protein EWM64_g525 [Hericium alpestre]|uniref:Uncharacterized protein n=1 Tax=Hericium alpestre TaxID=135208 RepID=A0A4Z0A8U0_9AGAM|nr:hypothetical protein EWM64_g525 [Hericium alpestre]